MIKWIQYMKTAKTLKTRGKFKAIEKDAVDAPAKDIRWEGEEVAVDSGIRLDADTGVGKAIVLRFFDFGSNLEAFKQHKPTAQELFDSHRRGMESLLWKDGLKPYDAIEPRFMFSKDKSHYRFILACIPTLGNVLADTPRTLTQLIKK
jgi:hypothetical protein